LQFEKQKPMKIKREVIGQMFNRAKKEAPIETCGYLAAKDGIIVASYELTNTDYSQEHFSFNPKEQFITLRGARAKGLEVCAVYHSHPFTAAWPSTEDIKLAYDPGLLYVIISLADGQEEIKAFRIRNQKVEPEILEVVNDG